MSFPRQKWPLLGLFAALACATAPTPAPSSGPRPSGATAAAAPALLPLASSQPPPAPPKVRLPGTVRPIRYAVSLALVPSSATFDGTVDVDVELQEATSVLWLNASELTVKAATLAGADGQARKLSTLAGDDQTVGFSTGAPVGPGTFHLSVTYQGTQHDKDTHGLFHQKEAGDWYAFSQFEPLDARKAFPCFDEPSFKVPWQLTLHVPKGLGAFSNTPVESEQDEAGGMKAVRFVRTRPLPSYLVALAVGPFEVVDAGRTAASHVPVRLVVTRGQGANAGYAARVSAAVVDKLEQSFNLPYPYEKLDVVGVPLTVGFGAMENPGLVTFNQHLVVWKKEENTIERERSFSLVATHEFAHQWFGDLVTMAWWDDLWLNESFASWMEYVVLEPWQPSWNLHLSRVNSRSGAMGGDSLVTARRIRQPILSEGDVVNAFDGITYQKGSAILTMFERYVGPEVFRRGITRYLKAHAYGNATAADFLAAISAEAGRDVAPAFTSFLDQPGVPLITMSLSCEKGAVPRLQLAQERYLPLGSRGDSHQRWQVPVCVRYGTGATDARACTLLTGAEGSLELPGKSCPTWVLPNAEATGYYRVKPAGDLLGKLLANGLKSLSEQEKVGLLSDVSALARGGQISTGEALAVVPRVLAPDSSRHIVGATVRIVSGVRDNLVPEEQLATYARFVRDTYGERARKLGFTPAKGESEETRLLRPQVVSLVGQDGEDATLIAEARALADKWLANRAAVDPEMVDAVLDVAARNGDAAFYERLHQAARASQDRDEREHLLSAMGHFRNPEQVKANFAVITSGEFDIREAMMLLHAGSGARETREVSFQMMKDNYEKFADKLPREVLPYLAFSGVGFCDAGHRAQVESFFKERSAKAPGGERVLAQVLESIDLCTAQKQRQESSVASFLKSYSERPASPPRAPARR